MITGSKTFDCHWKSMEICVGTTNLVFLAATIHLLFKIYKEFLYSPSTRYLLWFKVRLSYDLLHSNPYQEGGPYLPPLDALDTSVGLSPVSSCVIQNVWIIFRFRSAHVEVLSYFICFRVVKVFFYEYHSFVLFGLC